MDLINRQDAIDVLERKKDKTAKGDVGGFYNKIIQNDIDALILLPSAQKWIPCKECKWHGYLTCSNPDGIKGWVTDNDFCSYVERREDARNDNP